MQKSTSSQGPYNFACTFYGINPSSAPPIPTRSGGVPFALIFEGMIDVSTAFAQELLLASEQPRLKEVFAQSLLVLDRLIGRLTSSVIATWDPSRWLSLVLQILEQVVCIP
jgi:hypothetical protein